MEIGVQNGTGSHDRLEYWYNRQGERIKVKDHEQTVHDHTLDKLGRPIEEKVAVDGNSDIDDGVLRIDRAYNVRGALEMVTSFSSIAGGSEDVVNDFKLKYNDFDQPATEYQAHGGEVDDEVPVVSPNVQYAYTDGSNNHTRLTKVTYPNGRYLHYGYSGDDDDNMNRVSWLADDNGSGAAGTHLAEYTYLGLGQTVKVDYTQPDVLYNLAHGSGGAYDGLDAFDRVVDLRWTDYLANPDDEVVQIKHGYDRAGNRLWREDVEAAANSKDFDELYNYDGVYQLKDLDRGNLEADNGGKQIESGTLNFAEEWGLDATGNWDSFKQDTNGSGWDLEQTRDHNEANEIDGIDETTGPPWVTPSHDKAGNTTGIPQPSDPTKTYDLTYDAWNRLVKVEETVDQQLETVAEYQYDGANRRTLKKVYDDGSPDETRHFYYSKEWQVLEERVDTSTDADRQYVWGLRYIDDLILRDRDAGEGGDLGKTGSGLDERLYALQDPNWNVVALFGEVDSTWQVVERYAYDAYGTPKVLTPSFGDRSASDYDWEYLYTGRRLDAETGVYYYRARYYHPELGRFVSRDPMESLLGEQSAYLYAGANPLLYVDPAGLDKCCIDRGGPCVVLKHGQQTGKWLPVRTERYAVYLKIFAQFKFPYMGVEDPQAKDKALCKCCKFELWLKGTYTATLDGKNLPKGRLPGSGKPISATIYQQDSPRVPGTQVPLKGGKTGCRFLSPQTTQFGNLAQDAPGEMIHDQLHRQGKIFKVRRDYHYEARLIDSCQGNKIINRQRYDFQMRGDAPDIAKQGWWTNFEYKTNAKSCDDPMKKF